MSDLPIKSRVLKRSGHWLVILPSGRRVMFTTWRLAYWTGVRAVRKERDRVALRGQIVKDIQASYPRSRNAW